MPTLQALEAVQAGQGVRGVKVDKVRGVGRQDGPGVTFVSMPESLEHVIPARCYYPGLLASVTSPSHVIRVLV